MAEKIYKETFYCSNWHFDKLMLSTTSLQRSKLCNQICYQCWKLKILQAKSFGNFNSQLFLKTELSYSLSDAVQDSTPCT